MDSPIRAELTVERLLAIHPTATVVFLELKTSCVGCYMDRFCTLGEVATAYEVPLHELLDKLRESIQIL